MTRTPQHRLRPPADAMMPASDDAAADLGHGIFMSQGMSNSYVIVTDEGWVVVNAGMGFEGPTHRRAFDAVTSGPITHLVITQGHYDHVGGAQHLSDEGTRVVAQANWHIWHQDNDRLARFRTSNAGFAWMERVIEGMKAAAVRYPGVDLSQASPVPDVVVAEPTVLEVGGRRLELIPVEGGETTDSLIIWLPDDKVCFTGNAFGPLFGHVPNLVTMRGDRYRDALVTAGTIDLVRGLGAETIITGHYEPIVGAEVIEETLTAMHTALVSVHDQVVDGMNAGKNVHTLMREVRLPDPDAVGEGYGQTSWNVRAIWENYAGWFHHRSTTELYAVPATEVHADIVDLIGGPEPLLDRARQHLDDGRPLEALHLAEIAESSVGRTDEVKAVLLAAHEALLPPVTNFWEHAWLARQVRELS